MKECDREKIMTCSRRSLFKAMMASCVSVVLGSFLVAACHSKNPGSRETVVDPLDVDACDDLSKVTQEELKKRENFGYEEVTSLPDKRCDNCNLFIPAQNERKCGGCILFKGPVFEDSYCTYWAPQV